MIKTELIICFVLVMLMTMLVFKDINAWNNQMKIINAIHLYRMECVDKQLKPDVNYSDKENINSTFLRLWDWGYTRILSKDKFEIIKPYIR